MASEYPPLNTKYLITCLWLLCYFWLLPVTSVAETTDSSISTPSLRDYTRQIEQIETSFNRNASDSELIKKISKEALAIANYAKGCVTDYEAQLVKLNDSITVLGDGISSGVIAKPPKEIAQQRKDIENTLSQCRLLFVRAKSLSGQTIQAEQKLLKEHLFSKTQSVLEYSQGALSQPSSLQEEVAHIILALKSLPINLGNLYKAGMYGLLGLLTGILWRVYRRITTKNYSSALVKTSPVLATILHSIGRVLPALLLVGLINISFIFYPVEIPAVNDLAVTLLAFTVSYTILRAMLMPHDDLPDLSSLMPNTSHKLFYWGRVLLLTTLCGALFQSDIFDSEPPSNLVGLIRIALGTLIGLALMRVLWLSRKHVLSVRKLRLHFLGISVMLVAVSALWLGYSNISTFLFQGIFVTGFILLAGWLLYRIPVEVFDSIDSGASFWQRQLRRKMNLEQDQLVPGLLWLRLVHTLFLGSVIIIALLRLWGMSEQSVDLMIYRLVNGYQIGGFTLEPLSILSGLSIIAFGILLTQFVKRGLSQVWLKHTSLSQGAKEATETITGYTGVAVAVFIGLSVAGIDFGSLALIAGALSLGIGFGLQNIVNNFISGLILLFERPISRGDWIRVGTSEGFVKDISIRSTVITTFDRADIIVPNSELISTQVTNMTLNNQIGRVTIPIRVAYGANTRKVIDILSSVAKVHSGILREEGELKIQVLFMRFGESAMDFELRCHIKEVEKIFIITSELNLAIDDAFREAGIKIPFPRQVVYLAKDPPDEYLEIVNQDVSQQKP